MAGYAGDKNQVLTRLRRIEGQVRGLQRLVDQDTYCIEVLFRPLIDRRYRLDQIVEAYTYVETGQKIGNVVITVDSST